MRDGGGGGRRNSPARKCFHNLKSNHPRKPKASGEQSKHKQGNAKGRAKSGDWGDMSLFLLAFSIHAFVLSTPWVFADES